MCRSLTPGSEEGGFALALVVLLLFAIGVAGATSYEIVRTEAAMALNGMQGSQALAAAEAGLVRFMAEEDDTIPVERTYVVEDARAVVTPRMILEPRFPDRTYLLTSVGTYLDPRFAENAAERTVSRFAVHRRSPVPALGALMAPSTGITLDDVTQISGSDMATSSECPEAPADAIAGVVAAGPVSIFGGGVTGSPTSVSYGSVSATMDSLALDWDVLTDPSFPVRYDGTWPDFSSLHPDTFPLIRYDGNLNAYWWRSGRGALIVTGDLRLHDSFTWDGIILANDMNNSTFDETFVIRGLLAVGLDGVGETFTYYEAGTVRFHSCNVIAAGKKLARIDPMSRTWWEVH